MLVKDVVVAVVVLVGDVVERVLVTVVVGAPQMQLAAAVQSPLLVCRPPKPPLS